MEEILQAIQEGVKRVSKAIYTKDLGFSDTKNSSGEVQLKLDIQSDKIFEEELSKVKSLKAIASEEKKEVKEVEKSGEFLVAYDPLDGSSLVDVNLSVGSIFGIYK
ncbi:MAG: fructose-bisphosphatase class I, partial [Epsilonproteobacteria bacterium]|nr:fructose-bisphosphatase class I [Campylobacterota bacterium]